MSQFAPFPHHYQVRIDGLPDGRGTLSAAEHPEIRGGAPPEFGGSPGDWSPEELLLAAVNLCLMKSFDFMRQRAALPVTGYSGECEGVLEKTREGIVLTRVVASVRIRISDPAREPEARRLMEQSKRYCIISNSLKPAVEMKIEVEASSDG